ncbi:hypothetical protein [Bacillus sp. FJAT-49736]|uniref:hypothetical protein n=1 Tax=Bacillus sp. FJAT-49736 TaxID=2833582 RepID=UPI001BC98D5C|nr:hypothetical protein [Bacillus sp. FJAT-49736]MBS4174227.1 hypothetical protein [Bacillus sp. FJAT-49736]
MKKAAILFLLFFFAGSLSIAKAEQVNLKKITEIQATNPNVLIELVTPAVTEAVKEEHGEQAMWKPDAITKLSIHNDHTVKPSKRWYEIKMKIFVQGPGENEKHVDLVIASIKTKADLTKAQSKENLSDATVRVIEFIHDAQ